MSNAGASAVAKINGVTVGGTTGTGNVVFSAAPTFSGVVTFGGAIPNMLAVNVTSTNVPVVGINRPATNQLGFNTATTQAGFFDATQGLNLVAQALIPNMTQSSAAQTGTVCWTTGTGALTADTTVGCLTSLEEFKDIRAPISGALAIVNRLDPFWFKWKPGTNQRTVDQREQPGLGAHQVAAVDERLAGYDRSGALRGVRYQELTALLVAAIKEQQVEIDALKRRLP